MIAEAVQDIELIQETILDDEPRCSFLHNATVCSVHVTDRVITCAEGGLLCSVAAAQIESWKAEGRKHGVCHRFVRDCFEVLPA